MRRVLRKETAFRLYLLAFSVVCLLCGAFMLSQQSRFYRVRYSDLEKRLSSVVSQLEDLKNSQNVSVPVPPSSDVVLTPLQQKVKKESERLFWVEGTGNNRRYAYMDLCFHDGFRARYYFRPYPSRGELIALHRRIEHDALSHYDLPFESDFEG